MRITALALASAAATLLVGVTGCTDAKPKGVEATDTTQEDGLSQLLAQVPATIGDNTSITYSAESVLAKDDALSEPAQGVRGMGAGSLTKYVTLLKDDLSIDILQADAVVTVGQEPQQVTVIRGGQDAEAITAAAKEHGWTGDEVLSQDMDLKSSVLTTSVGHILAKGDSVILGGQSADLTAKPGKVPESVESLATCLGDSPAASFAASASAPTAAGLKAGSPLSGVLCAYASDPDQAEALGRSVQDSVDNDLSNTGTPYGSLLTVEDLSHPTATTSRVEVGFTEGRPPGLLWQMQQRRDLPGLD
ncbi:MAG: hypothetical protein ACTII7_02245 [Galactobacter sp.]